MAPSAATEFVDVHNPATAELLARTPISNSGDVDAAVQAAADAFPRGAARRPASACNISSS